MQKLMMKDESCFRERITETVRQCLHQCNAERPELHWLKEKYEYRRAEYGLDKKAMDALIYERIYKKPPGKVSDTLKIRYWRTGHHYPANRQLCADFARSLELNEEERHFLLTAWMDKSADFYEQVPSLEDTLYWNRRERMLSLSSAYFRLRAPSDRCFSYGAFRHCYYLDALSYIDPDRAAAIWKGTIHSINYDSELKRNSMLLGEIPRKTLLRHLILLSLPDLTLEKLQEDLAFFGYLPLTPKHTLTGGEALDKLVLETLDIHRLISRKYDPNTAMNWFRRCWQELDFRFAAQGKTGFRLFYFKSLG